MTKLLEDTGSQCPVVHVRSEKNGLEHVYDSVEDASRKLGLQREYILEALESGPDTVYFPGYLRFAYSCSLPFKSMTWPEINKATVDKCSKGDKQLGCFRQALCFPGMT